jgi:anti-sigma B factor antagonist
LLDDDRAARRLGQLCSMRIERTLGTVLIRMQGEFDMACGERFQDELEGALEDETEVLILDLCGLQFMDSTGLRMLVTLKSRTSEDGIEYTVLCGEGAMRRILRATGVDGVLPVVSASSAPRSDSPA